MKFFKLPYQRKERIQTIETELDYIGYQIEEARIGGKSLSKELRERILKVRQWAKVSGISEAQQQYLINEGGTRARRVLSR